MDHCPCFPSPLTSYCQRKKVNTLVLSVFILVSRCTNATEIYFSGNFSAAFPLLFYLSFANKCLHCLLWSIQFLSFPSFSPVTELLSQGCFRPVAVIFEVFYASAQHSLLTLRQTKLHMFFLSYVTSVPHAFKPWLFTFAATTGAHPHSRHHVNVSPILLALLPLMFKNLHSLLILIVLIVFDALQSWSCLTKALQIYKADEIHVMCKCSFCFVF